MNKILVVIDCQNDFIDGTLRNEEAIKRVPNIVNYINNFKGEIIFTQDTHYDETYFNTLEGKKLPVKHCILGTKGWELNKDVKNVIIKNSKENNTITFVVPKNTFGSVDKLKNSINCIINEHQNNPIDEIIFCGFCTDICVISNVLITRANFPNIKITVLKDCCAGVTPESHEAALTVMKSCQIDVE